MEARTSSIGESLWEEPGDICSPLIGAYWSDLSWQGIASVVACFFGSTEMAGCIFRFCSTRLGQLLLTTVMIEHSSSSPCRLLEELIAEMLPPTPGIFQWRPSDAQAARWGDAGDVKRLGSAQPARNPLVTRNSQSPSRGYASQ